MAKITKVSHDLIKKQIRILVFTDKQIKAKVSAIRCLQWNEECLTHRMGQTFSVGGVDPKDNTLFIWGEFGEPTCIWLRPQWVELLD